MQKLANLIENGSLKNLAQNTVTCADYGSFSERILFEICQVGALFATTELFHKDEKLAALKRRLFLKTASRKVVLVTFGERFLVQREQFRDMP